MQGSLLKTLANKHKSSVRKESRRLKAVVITDEGPRKCLEIKLARKDAKPLIARFGGIPLSVKNNVIIKDQQIVRARLGRNELVTRLMGQTCEQCGSNDNIEVHHIRKLSDLKKQGRKEKPDWMKLMSSMNRKTLVLCRTCHRNLHAGRPMRSIHHTSNWRAV